MVRFWRMTFTSAWCSNALSIGGIKLPQQDVELDDGLFEVDLVKKPVSLADVTDGFQTLFAQNPVGAGSRIHFQASQLTFSSDQPIPWTIDGEYGGDQLVNQVVNCRPGFDCYPREIRSCLRLKIGGSFLRCQHLE